MKKQIRVVTFLIIAGVLCGVLAGCGKTEPTPGPSPASPAVTSPSGNTNTPGAADQQQKRKFADKKAEIMRYEENADYGATTAEMRTTTHDVYQKWDDFLNEIFQYLERNLPADEFEKLEKEQSDWLKARDAKAEADSAEMKGGTGEALLYTGSLLESTKLRCDELLTSVK